MIVTIIVFDRTMRFDYSSLEKIKVVNMPVKDRTEAFKVLRKYGMTKKLWDSSIRAYRKDYDNGIERWGFITDSHDTAVSFFAGHDE